MPRYYFDTIDGERDCDEHGIQLAGEDAAVSEAVRYAGALIADQPSMLDHPSPLEVTVRSDDRTVAVIRIALSRQP